MSQPVVGVQGCSIRLVRISCSIVLCVAPVDASITHCSLSMIEAVGEAMSPVLGKVECC
jgi:hypothetical protein